MSQRNIVVDGVESLSRPAPTDETWASPAAGQATVTFRDGSVGTLDPRTPTSKVWAEVLESLQHTKQPAYVEIDPATGIITELLCPLTVRVATVGPTTAAGDVEVELIISHARHFVRAAHPKAAQLLAALRTALANGSWVLVTETPQAHEIIDVRPIQAPPALADEGTAATGTSPEMGFEMAPVSDARARQLFAQVNAKLCCPASAPAPCIPFLFPDDGCWGRAHEMYRLMTAAGAQPGKVWIYGSLRAATRNHPACQVFWGWHVAPTLAVSTSSGLQTYVIDPSLFPEPVTQATWASVQGDPGAVLVPSPGPVFYRNRSGSQVEYDDAAYTKTKQVLTTYRNQLRLRCASANGPPPYPACLPKPAGVQWVGLIAPKATGRWFSWGWPANWHMAWTVMPLTPCPGGPQLTWSVQVERANATQCTYWITVKNLSSDPVRFEGRFDILKR